MARLLPLVAAALACCLLPSVRASQFDPHVANGVQSWFEGWNLRLTTDPAASDAGAPSSLALIVGVIPDAPPQAWNGTMLSLMVQNSRWGCGGHSACGSRVRAQARRRTRLRKSSCPATARLTCADNPSLQNELTTRSLMDLSPLPSAPVLLLLLRSLTPPAPAVYSRQGMTLSIATAGGRPVSADPDFSSPPNFTIAADDGSLLLRMDGESCQLEARLGEAYLQAECTGPPVLWSPSGRGPEGGCARGCSGRCL